MARLYKHGAERFRLRKDYAEDAQGFSRYTVYAFMSDETVLRKQGWTRTNAQHSWEDESGDSGWKVLKPKEEFKDQSALEAHLLSKGFNRVSTV